MNEFYRDLTALIENTSFNKSFGPSGLPSWMIADVMFQAVQSLDSPPPRDVDLRVSVQEVDDLISHAEYRTFGLTTVCLAVTKNGHHIVGQSHCVDPAVFDASKGAALARSDVGRKIQEMEVYARRSIAMLSPPASQKDPVVGGTADAQAKNGAASSGGPEMFSAAAGGATVHSAFIGSKEDLEAFLDSVFGKPQTH